MPSVFARILAGQIPGQFVFRDELWAALLDIHPAAPGHALLIPLHQAQYLADLPASTLAALGDRLARLTAAVKTASGAPAVSIVLSDGPAAGQEVPHVHFHVFPRFPNDGMPLSWPATPYADGELARWAERLRTAWK